MLHVLNTGMVPSLTHLLMGYEISTDPTSIERSLLLPRQEHSCVSVLLEALQANGYLLARAAPNLYASILQLLYELAANPSSGPAMLLLVSPSSQGDVRAALLAELCEVLALPLPASDQESAPEVAARLQQKAALLQLQALQLLRAERRELVRPLVEALLQGGQQGSMPAFGAAGSAGQSVLLGVLDEVADVQVGGGGGACCWHESCRWCWCGGVTLLVRI